MSFAQIKLSLDAAPLLVLQFAAAKEVVAPRPLGDDPQAFPRTALASQQRYHPQEHPSSVIRSPPPDPNKPRSPWPPCHRDG